MDKLKIFWPHNKVQFVGRSISEAWAEELEKYGFETTQTPTGADMAFFISDSMLNEKVIASMPTVAYFWGWPPERMLDEGYRQKWGQTLAQLSRCTRVLTPGPTVSDQLTMFGIANEVCLPGVDAKTLGAMELSVPVDAGQVAFLSRLAPHKGLERLIEAASLLKPAPRILAMGPGSNSAYDAYAKKLGVECIFLEPTDREKVVALRQSACLVHPSSYEGFGLPPLEALFLKVPVISWDTPQARYVLKEDAFYAESVDELAQLMAEVLTRQDEVRKIAERASERIAATLTLTHAAERLWVHLHRMAKEWWGKKVHADPTNPQLIREAYEAEARRNWAYSYGPKEWEGPARFDPGWARHWRAQHYINEFKTAGANHIADIGCGPVYPTIFALAGFRDSCLDVAQTTLDHVAEIARKHGVGVFPDVPDGAPGVFPVQGYAQNLPWFNNSFDGAVIGEMLEHVPDPDKCLAEAYRVTKPGGVILFTSPVGIHHWDPMHMAPDHGGWDDASIDKLLAPYKGEVVKKDTVAEDGTEPSCYLAVIRKKVSA